MFKQLLLASLFVSGIAFVSEGSFAEISSSDVSVVTNCSGTQIVRIAPGKFEVRYVESDLPGCVGKTSTGNVNPSSSNTIDVVITHEVTNCSGLRVTTLSNGKYASTRVAPSLVGCIDTTSKNTPLETPRIDLSQGPLLDLASTDIAHYRTELLKKQGIRFANAIRSVRMRQLASMASRTNAYLISGDAVVISGKETGWVETQGAELIVIDTHENTVETDTTNKASGYMAAKYLRNPNNSDLVRIKQADHAYWSDIARVKVSHMVNVRSHPWYTSSIVITLRNDTPLYVVRTVDNWSEIRNDSGTLHGYIRSDFLSVDRAQRVENSDTAKNLSPVSLPSKPANPDSSWIAF